MIEGCSSAYLWMYGLKYCGSALCSGGGWKAGGGKKKGLPVDWFTLMGAGERALKVSLRASGYCTGDMVSERAARWLNSLEPVCLGGST